MQLFPGPKSRIRRKPSVIGRELFFAVSYSKPTLAYCRVGQNDSRGKQIAVVEISAHFIAQCLDKPLKLMA